MIKLIDPYWDSVCIEAQLTEIDKRFMMGRQFLNPFSFEDLEGERTHLKEMADTIRQEHS